MPSYSSKSVNHDCYYDSIEKHCILLYSKHFNLYKTTEYEDLKRQEFLNDVWIQEAIVKAITIVYKCDSIRAEQLFSTIMN